MNAEELLRHFADRLPEALDLLRQMVELESHSLDKPGVDAFGAWLAAEFGRRGGRVRILQSAERGNSVRVDCPDDTGESTVLLLGHLDTVWERGTITRRPFRIDGGRAFGPGVFDMKGGLLVALLVLEALAEEKPGPVAGVRCLFTADEEIGTAAGLPHLRAAAEGCRAVLCLEPPLPGGRAKTFRKGVGNFTLRVAGRAAHAGVDHEKGANAIVELSRQITRLHDLTDYARGITVSVGTVWGGTASNVVPAEAVALVDFRVRTLDDGRRVEQQVRSLGVVDPRCKLEVEGGLNRPPLERSPEVVQLYERARRAALEVGMDLGEGETGGGSDGSFTAAMGIPTLDGLGVDGDGAHSEEEHIIVGDIPRRGAFLSTLLSLV